MGQACWWLEPLERLLHRYVMSSTRIFADDTPSPVLDPGRGRTKTGQLWGHAVDDRPWNGDTPPAVVHLHGEDRRGEHPAAHLAGFEGILQGGRLRRLQAPAGGSAAKRAPADCPRAQRKNAPFAGPDGGARHWALGASLIGTAKLDRVEPLAWLTDDALERIVAGRTKASELERLPPWTRKTERAAAAVDASAPRQPTDACSDPLSRSAANWTTDVT